MIINISISSDHASDVRRDFDAHEIEEFTRVEVRNVNFLACLFLMKIDAIIDSFKFIASIVI